MVYLTGAIIFGSIVTLWLLYLCVDSHRKRISKIKSECRGDYYEKNKLADARAKFIALFIGSGLVGFVFGGMWFLVIPAALLACVAVFLSNLLVKFAERGV